MGFSQPRLQGQTGALAKGSVAPLSPGSQEYLAVLQGWPERALVLACGTGTYQLEQQASGSVRPAEREHEQTPAVSENSLSVDQRCPGQVSEASGPSLCPTVHPLRLPLPPTAGPVPGHLTWKGVFPPMSPLNCSFGPIPSVWCISTLDHGTATFKI